MSYIKKRVPRKPGMTPQEIIADQATLSGWISDNLNRIILGAGSVLLVLVIVLGVIWMKGEKRKNANSALSRAMAVYQTTVAEIPEGTEGERDNLVEALNSLEKAAADYPGLPQGQMAALFKANVLFRLGRYRETAETIRDLKEKNSEILSEINAHYLLAKSYEAVENFPAAIESYGVAKDRAGGNMRPVIDIDLARCYELSGNTEKAISLYRAVLSEYPGSSYSTRAEKKLAVLGIPNEEAL